MAGSLGVVVLVSVAFTFATTVDAEAQSGGYSGRTADEMKCQSGVGKSLGKFAGVKTKCVQKCIATQRKAVTPAYAGCFGPGFTDPATSACVTDPVKGAETRARASITKACSNDCPSDCYDPSACSTGGAFVIAAEQRLDSFDDLIWCVEAAGATPTKAEQKCEDMVAKTTSKLAGSISKCYNACVVKEFKGTIPLGSCLVPAPFDPAAATCLTKAVAKSSAKIDSKCAIPGANPTCYVPANDTGTEFADLTKYAVEFEVPLVFCGSPSGAFLD